MVHSEKAGSWTSAPSSKIRCGYSNRSGKSQQEAKILKRQEKSVNFYMGQEIWKFTKKSGKSGIDISMKALFQILTVSIVLGQFVNQAII